MLFSALAYIATVDPAHRLADLLAKAHRDAPLEHLRAVQTTLQNGRTTKVTFNIVRQSPDRFSLVAQDPSQPAEPKQWLFGPGQVIVIEPSTKKYMARNLPEGTDLKAAVEEELAPYDAFARLLLRPDGMREWADFIKSNPNWKVNPAKPVLTLKQNNISGEVAIDPRTHRLTRFSNVLGGVTTTWTVTYGEVKGKDPFTIPADGYQVAQFSDPNRLPKMDAATKTFVTRVLRTYEPPASLAFKVTDANGTTTVHYTRKGIYQKDSVAEFDYNGQKVDLKTTKGAVYSGPAKQEQLLAATSNLGTRVDPFLRDLVLGINPVQRILESADTANLAGTTTINGQSCRILQAKGDQLNLTFYIRQSDNFIVRITTSLPGDVNYKASRDFEKIKGAPTLPQVEAPSNARPLTQLTD